MAQAGVRIRYRRIERDLQALGHHLRVVPIQSINDQSGLAHDVYIISKCYDARAFLVARLLQGRDKLIGIDLFDDYFSQRYDSRFTSLRYWLHTLLQTADFVLCSTPMMRDLAGRFAPELAKHVMNDPAVLPNDDNLRRALRRKLECIQATTIVSICWFGIGDNPHFPVGLTDLVAFSGDLHRLRRRGFDIRLDILTNRRAMTTDGLAMLRRLAVPYEVEEWTEEREKQLLEKSVACFLPVNSQNFSVAKSLNRAVSALCAGVQVLSSGFPLYEALAPLVYRDPAKLLDDVRQNTLALREDTVSDLMRLLQEWADPVVETRSLVAFLHKQIERRAGSLTAAGQQPPAALIHGKNTTSDVHKLAQRMGVLSVCSPFCNLDLNFDLRFAFATDRQGFDVLIADRHASMLGRDIQALMSSGGKILDTIYQKLDMSRLFPSVTPDGSALARMDSPMSVAASYPYVMASIMRTLQHLFPAIQCYNSEQATLPWSVLREDPHR